MYITEYHSIEMSTTLSCGWWSVLVAWYHRHFSYDKDGIFKDPNWPHLW